jgi:hypothetical protein
MRCWLLSGTASVPFRGARRNGTEAVPYTRALAAERPEAVPYSQALECYTSHPLR